MKRCDECGRPDGYSNADHDVPGCQCGMCVLMCWGDPLDCAAAQVVVPGATVRRKPCGHACTVRRVDPSCGGKALVYDSGRAYWIGLRRLRDEWLISR